MYLQPTNGAPPVMTNILQEGESVGDIDVLDNARRSVSCITMEGGAKVVRVSERVFSDFVRKHPHAATVPKNKRSRDCGASHSFR